MAGSTNLSLSDRAGKMSALPAARLALSVLLLALTVLSNFFNAITASVFILMTIANDLVQLRRAAKSEGRGEERNALLLPAFANHCAVAYLVLDCADDH